MGPRVWHTREGWNIQEEESDERNVSTEGMPVEGIGLEP